MGGNLTLFGGNFQDAEGNVLNAGYLLFELSHDEEYVIGSSQIVAGLKFRVTLDSTGNIPLTPATKIYSNDVLLPSGSFYLVRCFKADGTSAWSAPQYWQLNASPNPLDVGTIVPANPPGSGLAGTGGSTLLLQTNEANNGDQSLLDLHAGNGITLSDNGVGRVTVAGLTLKTNGTTNGSQTTLNIAQGSGITVADGGTGTVTVSASSSTPATSFMIGAGNFTPIAPGGVGAGNVTDSALRVTLTRFNLPYTIAGFNRMNLFARTSNGAGTDFNVAIYDNTKALAWEAGAQHIANSGSFASFSYTTASLSLSAGTYYLAATASDTQLQWFGWDLSVLSFDSGSSDGNIINKNSVTYGYSSTAAGAGPAMPASLGTLNAYTVANNFVSPAIFFEAV